eukprot:Lithocolla_globosa_v1_NODE_1667_length_2409_cov_9.852229.p5 type:complete len:103 gc:universal NODE_1667_length_2409_cov_9.852229:1311-1619(+)
MFFFQSRDSFFFSFSNHDSSTLPEGHLPSVVFTNNSIPSLAFWLPYWVVETRKEKPKGEKCPPKTLYGYANGLMRAWNSIPENDSNQINFWTGPCLNNFTAC